VLAVKPERAFRASPSARLDRSSAARAFGFHGFDAANRPRAAGFGRRSHGGETPSRVGAVTAKRPKRSGGAPKALDGDGAIGSAATIAQLSTRHRNHVIT